MIGAMVVMLIPLVFAVAAILAAVALAATWRRYRGIALGNIAALRRAPAERSFEVRIGRLPALVGSAAGAGPAWRRWPQRLAIPRRSAAAAGLRAAA